MDALERRNAANGYVWAYRQLKDGIKTIAEIEVMLECNPMYDWRKGAKVAIEDYLTEKQGDDVGALDSEAGDSEGGDCD